MTALTYLPDTRQRLCLAGACIFTAFTPVTAQAEWVEWIADANITLEYTDNLNYSAFDNDSFSDRSLRAALDGGRFFQLNGNTRFWASLHLDYALFDRFDSLDGATYGGELGIRHKFGVGPQVPVLVGYVRYQDYSPSEDSWQQDGWEYQVKLSKRFSERIDASLGFSHTRLRGTDNPAIDPNIPDEVFDEEFNHMVVAANVILAPSWLLSASYSYRSGDFHSACTPANVSFAKQVENILGLTSDPVFGGCVYRVDGSANKYNINLSYEISRHSALNLGYLHSDGKADVLEYKANVSYINLSYSY